MSIGLRLDLRQSQQLVMTPQLQQAIKLLTMSNMELTDFVEAEVEKNPLLEIAEAAGEAAQRAEEGAQASNTDGAVSATDTVTNDHTLAAETFDTGAENLVDTSPSDGPSPLAGVQRTGQGGGAGADLQSLEDRLAARRCLRDELYSQLSQWPDGGELVDTVARYLVEELDEHGYLRSTLDDIAQRLGTELGIAEDALQRVQACEPTGVGARSIGECLALQLAERDRLDPAMRALVEHLYLLQRGDLARLRAVCGVDAEDFSAMITELRSLDPRPCDDFDTVEPSSVVPDIVLTRTSWGGWQLELNADTLPKVLLDRTYKTEFPANGCEEAKAFLADCHSNATWLIKSLDQRAKTILKVATEVVTQQERFFSQGIAGLQPLTLKAVADAVDMHESTVSRVTSNKYIATERGIFDLKFFFTNAVGGEDSGVSSTTVRHKIKALVDDEDNTGVLSDDAIVENLRSDGIEIARRTVAKYRKSLKIPSSVERRRLRALTAGG